MYLLRPKREAEARNAPGIAASSEKGDIQQFRSSPNERPKGKGAPLRLRCGFPALIHLDLICLVDRPLGKAQGKGRPERRSARKRGGGGPTFLADGPNAGQAVEFIYEEEGAPGDGKGALAEMSQLETASREMQINRAYDWHTIPMMQFQGRGSRFILAKAQRVICGRRMRSEFIRLPPNMTAIARPTRSRQS